MATAKISIKDEVYCFVTGLATQHQKVLFDKFGILIEGAPFHPAVKLGRWDGKIRFFEPTGKTYNRILDQIVPELLAWEYEIEIEDKRVQVKRPEHRATSDMFGHIMGYRGQPLEVRPYQVEAINALVEEGSGFVIAGTGAGKSLITAGLCEVYGRTGYRTITVVPSGDLVAQTFDAFKMCGMDVGRYSGEHKELHAQHVVATWQSLQNAPQLMKLFQVVVIDEAHGAKADVIKSLISDHGGHIAFRFGVTGTFPKPKIDQMTLITTIGSILKTITSKWLIDNGYLAEVEIEIIETQESVDLPDYSAEKAYLARAEDRLDHLAWRIKQDMKLYGNTLVLVNSIPFGRKLAKLIEGSVFLSGESENELRQDYYKEYEHRDDMVVIATSGIASTGISIDRIFCLYLIDAGKSFIKAIQSIGRGLRRAEDKNKVYVKDVSSCMKYSKKHCKERIKWYDEAGYPRSKPKKITY
jgi:superfamily II DNA or RNA helicase